MVGGEEEEEEAEGEDGVEVEGSRGSSSGGVRHGYS